MQVDRELGRHPSPTAVEVAAEVAAGVVVEVAVEVAVELAVEVAVGYAAAAVGRAGEGVDGGKAVGAPMIDVARRKNEPLVPDRYREYLEDHALDLNPEPYPEQPCE